MPEMALAIIFLSSTGSVTRTSAKGAQSSMGRPGFHLSARAGTCRLIKGTGDKAAERRLMVLILLISNWPISVGSRGCPW